MVAITTTTKNNVQLYTIAHKKSSGRQKNRSTRHLNWVKCGLKFKSSLSSSSSFIHLSYCKSRALAPTYIFHTHLIIHDSRICEWTFLRFTSIASNYWMYKTNTQVWPIRIRKDFFAPTFQMGLLRLLLRSRARVCIKCVWNVQFGCSNALICALLRAQACWSIFLLHISN